MKLKHLLLAGIAAGAANMAMAVETITFQGDIAANTCTVQVNSQASPTVTLPTVGTVDLGSSGKTAGATPFTVNLIGCVATADDVQVRFVAHTEAGANLGLDSTSTAGNVVVQLLEGYAGGSPINFSGGVAVTSRKTTESGAASFPLTAQYYATGVASAGTVQAIADYEVIYP
ncbi:fimbrial protein [Acinetobacter sp. AL9]|uniref:fimbrial protein n=1 Tax=Acinetobacter sp. AL9 TaxID=3273234 RepID=UPI0035578F14